jgi:hypothetical protein
VLAQKLNNECAMGINAYSYEWHDLAKRLSVFEKFGPSLVAGDFSGYDGSEKAFIHWKILDIINEWYDDSDDNQRVRSILWLELVNSRHVIYDVLYQWFDSLPSGHPLTTFVNCMYNQIAIRYCYVRATADVDSFERNVKFFCLGDDNTFCVSPDVQEMFNEITIPGYMSELGLTYTRESKRMTTEDDTPFRTLEEVSFLKRSFRFEPLLGRYVGPLDLDSVADIPLWTKKGPNSFSIFVDNVQECVNELSLHSDNVYKSFTKRIKKGLDEVVKEHDIKFEVMTDRLTTLSKVTGN